MLVIFSHSKYINFTASWSVAACQSVSLWPAGRQPLAGHRLTDWAKQKLALEPSSLRPHQLLIRPR